MSATFILEVQAKPEGLAVLAKEFQKLEATIAATAKGAQAAINGLGKDSGSGAAGLAKMRSDLDQALAAVKTLQAANEDLTRKVQEGSSRRAKTVKEEADAHVQAFQKAQSDIGRLQDAAAAEDRKRSAKRISEQKAEAANKLDTESEVSLKLINVAIAQEGERRKLVQKRVAENFAAAQRYSADWDSAYLEDARRQAAAEAAKLKETQRSTTVMKGLRWDLQQERQRATEAEVENEGRAVGRMIAQRQALYRSQQADTLFLLNSSIGVGAKTSAQDQAAGWALLNNEIGRNAKATQDAQRELEKHNNTNKEANALNKQHAENLREVHSAARGAAGSLGVLWATYGASTTLLVGAFALTSAIRDSIKASTDWAYQMAFVGAITRKEGESMAEALARAGKVGGDALKLMEDSLYAPKEGADAMRQLAQAGLTAEQSLAVLPAVMNLATVGEMKMGEAAFSTVAILNAFNKETKDAGLVVDEMSKAAAMSTTSVSMITESMKQASVVGEQFGVSLEETLTALTLLADRGIRGSAAGTAFRNMVSGLYAPTKQAAETMKLLGLSAFDAEKNMKPISVLMGELRQKLEQFDKPSQLKFLGDLATERGAKAMSAYLDELQRVPDILNQIGKASGFAKETTDALKGTVQGEWKQAMASMEAAFVRAGSAAQGPLLEAVTKLKDAFRSPEFQSGISSLLTGFVNIASFVTTNGKMIIDFIEGVLAYKAGKFLWPLAQAGVAQVGTGLAGLAATAGMWAAKGGLLFAALFGGYQIGEFLSKFDVIRDAVGYVFSDVFKVISMVSDALDKWDARKALNKDRKKTGSHTEYTEFGAVDVDDYESDAEVTARLAAEAAAKKRADEAAAYRKFRQNELATAAEENRKRQRAGMAVGTKSAPNTDAAKDEVTFEIAKYRLQEQAAQAHYNAQLTILKAYRDGRMITEAEYEKREDELTSAYLAAEVDREKQHVADLLVQRNILISKKKETNKIDVEIARAEENLAKARDRAEVESVKNAVKQWKDYNAAGENVLESAKKANQELRAQNDVLKEGLYVKKDHILVTVEGRIKTEEETLARLENSLAMADQLHWTELNIMAAGKEVEAIRARIAALKKERDDRKGLLDEKKALEDNFWIGAAKGLDAYIDHSLTSAKIMENAFKKGFQGIEDALVNFVTTGKMNISAMLKSIGDDVVRMLIRLNITQPLARGLQSLLMGSSGVAATGAGAAQNVASQTGSNLLSNAASSYLGASLFSSAGAYAAAVPGLTAGGSQAAMLAAQTGEFGLSGLAATSAAGGSAAGGMAAMALEWIPYIGWAVAIGSLLYSMFGKKGGGPKAEGSFMGSFDGAGALLNTFTNGGGQGVDIRGTNSDINNSMKDAATSLIGQIDAAAQSFGVKATGFQLGMGASMDPNGTAPAFVHSLLKDASGNTLLRQFNDNVGRNQEDVQAEETIQGKRIILAALQSLHINDVVDAFLDTVDASTATAEKIDALLAQAKDIKTILDYGTADPFSDAAKIAEENSKSLLQKWRESGTSLREQLKAYDQSAAATAKIAQMTRDRYAMEIELIQQVKQVQQQTHDTIQDSIRSLRYSVLDNAGKYDFLDRESASLMDQLRNSDDPMVIQRLAQKLNDDINTAFQLLDPEQQKAKVEEFVARLTDVDNLTNSQLESVNRELARERNTELANSITDAITEAFKPITDAQGTAANTQQNAANTNLAAAQTPLTVNVTVQDGRASVEVGSGG